MWNFKKCWFFENLLFCFPKYVHKVINQLRGSKRSQSKYCHIVSNCCSVIKCSLKSKYFFLVIWKENVISNYYLRIHEINRHFIYDNRFWKYTLHRFFWFKTTFTDLVYFTCVNLNSCGMPCHSTSPWETRFKSFRLSSHRMQFLQKEICNWYFSSYTDNY